MMMEDVLSADNTMERRIHDHSSLSSEYTWVKSCPNPWKDANMQACCTMGQVFVSILHWR
jgi:hypothetical protein